MKFSKLLVLSALSFFGLGAYAADLVERTAPEEPASALIEDIESVNKTAVDFVVGDAYVLYNKGAAKYYYQGNAWGTQATGSVDQAMIVRFVMPNGKSLADKALYLRNYVPSKSAWMTAFITTGDGNVSGVYGTGTAALFVDNNDGDAALMWVEANGEKTYRISISELNSATTPDGCFLGIDDNGPGVGSGEPGTCIMPKLAEGEGVHLDWEFYAVPEWTEYYKAKDIYDMSVKLKAQIETAEGAGIDVSAAAAVYNNANSTVEEMQKAIDDLLAAMAGLVGNGTADNPSDATPLLKSPNFDGASFDGWQGTAPNMVGSGSHGPADVAEHYNKTFDTYQVLSSLPNGVYAFRANTFFRGTWEDYMQNLNQDCYPYLYATTGGETSTVLFNNAWSAMNTEPMAGATEFGTTASETQTGYGGVTYYIPNDPSAFRLYEEKGFYGTTLFFEVTDGNLQVGVKKDKLEGGSDWAVFDTFTLKYYGNTAESFQKWVEESAPSFSLTEEDLYTQSYMDAFNEAVAAGKATNKAEALAAIEAIKAAAAPLQENLNLWKQWQSTLADAKALSIEEDYGWTEGAGEINDYADLEAEEIIDARALTNEELKAEIEKIKALVEKMKEEFNKGIPEDKDVTNRFLTNADLEQGSTGWTTTHDTSVGNFVAGGWTQNHGWEAWHVKSFDFYQEVKNAPVGVYEISVQGYVRYLDGQEAITNAESRPANIPIYVYLNDSKTPLANWLDYPQEPGFFDNFNTENGASCTYLSDANGNEYPDNMTGALATFSKGDYKVSAYGLVAKEGDTFRVGVAGNPGVAQFWPLWDNFTLVYRGFKPEVLTDALTKALTTIDTSRPMAASLKVKADELNASAQTALTSQDGQAMFEVLSEIYALTADINASVELFAKLVAANEDLIGAANDSENATVKAEALALVDEIDAAVNDSKLENADAEAYLVKIDELKAKLRLPMGLDAATDEKPVDATSVIVNADFETLNADGWTYAFEAVSNIGFQNNATYTGDDAASLANFIEGWRSGNAAIGDGTIEQTIKFLPEGTYTLEADILANLQSRAAGEIAADGEGIYLFAAEKDGAKSAISVATANGSPRHFALTFKKASENDLTIGLEAKSATANWLAADNFKLTYFGKASGKTVDGDATGIETIATAGQTVKVEYFTLDGRKATSVQKGIMVQKVTFENGATIVRKIRK